MTKTPKDAAEPATVDQAETEVQAAAEVIAQREREAADAARAADELANAIAMGETSLKARDLAAAREEAAHAPLLVEAACRVHAAAVEALRRRRLAALAREVEALTPPDVPALIAAVDAATEARDHAVNTWNARLGDIVGRARALSAPTLAEIEDGVVTDAGVAFEAPGQGLVVGGRCYTTASVERPSRELLRDAVAVRPQSREDMIREIEANAQAKEREREARRMANLEQLHDPTGARQSADERAQADAQRDANLRAIEREEARLDRFAGIR